MLQKKNLTRYLTIDGFRGFGCLYVFLIHSLEFHKRMPNFINLMPAAVIFMNCFFVLSGFLVFKSARVLKKKHSSWKLKFLVLRFFRIVPLWWFILVLYSIYPGFSLPQLMINASFLFGFVSYNTFYAPIIPAWSLFVEESFYLLMPALWFCINSFKKSLMLFILFFALSCVWIIGAHQLKLPTDNYYIFNFPFAVWHYFILGIIFSYISEKLELVKVYKPNLLFKTVEVCTVFAVFFPWPRLFFIREIITALFVFFILFSNGLLFKILSFKFLQWCGRRCYFIYLSHSLAIIWLFNLNLKYFEFNNYDKFYWILEIVVVLLASNLTWKYFEKPFINYSRKLIQR